MTRAPLFKFVVLTALVLLSAVDAKADTYVTASGLAVFATSQSTNEANFVQFGVTVSGCTSNRAYIEYTEKQMFALAMAANASAKTIYAYVDTGATGKNIPASSGTAMTCKVTAIWF